MVLLRFWWCDSCSWNGSYVTRKQTGVQKNDFDIRWNWYGFYELLLICACTNSSYTCTMTSVLLIWRFQHSECIGILSFLLSMMFYLLLLVRWKKNYRWSFFQCWTMITSICCITGYHLLDFTLLCFNLSPTELDLAGLSLVYPLLSWKIIS